MSNTLKYIMILCLSLAAFFKVSYVVAQETEITSIKQEDDQYFDKKQMISDEEVETIILFDTLNSLKKVIYTKNQANKVYQCNTPLTLAIRGVLAIQELGEKAPQYAVDKMKYLISIGADPDQEICTKYPLALVLSIPLELDGYEELAKQAIDEELKKGSEICNIPGITPKPCKDITAEELKQVKKTLHESFSISQRMIFPYLMEMLSFLIDNGADINKKDSSRGRTALHNAVGFPSYFSIKPIKYLLDKGADINSRDFDGNTPLFLAKAINNQNAVRMLIEAGADTTIRNNEGLLYDEVIGLQRTKSLQEIRQEFENK